jgi:uncharacterized protein
VAQRGLRSLDACRDEQNRSSLGVISDTRGLLRPHAAAWVRSYSPRRRCRRRGGARRSSRAIAPTHAIRRTQHGPDPCRRPTSSNSAGFVLRAPQRPGTRPRSADGRLCGSGVRPLAPARDRDTRGVLYLNPGSAGPRRFRLPVTIARVAVVSGRKGIEAEIVELDHVAGRAHGPVCESERDWPCRLLSARNLMVVAPVERYFEGIWFGHANCRWLRGNGNQRPCSWRRSVRRNRLSRSTHRRLWGDCSSVSSVAVRTSEKWPWPRGGGK